MVSAATAFHHFTLDDLFIDLLLLATAVVIGGFMDGIKLRSFEQLGNDAGVVTFLLVILPVGISLIAIYYALTLAKVILFDWRLWTSCFVTVVVFSGVAYLLSVKYAAKSFDRKGG